MLTSDNGIEYVNQIITLLTIVHLKTAIYHPEVNGRFEIFHKILNDILARPGSKKLIFDIPSALLAYHTSAHDGTKFTPFYFSPWEESMFTHGHPLATKIKIFSGRIYIKTMLARLHGSITLVKENGQVAREKVG